MVLPNFLIIGAMKAGTTSLSDALSNHPEVFIPASKEPNSLVEPEILSTAGLAEYERLFDRASPAVAIGEASTGYTKRHLGGANAATAAAQLLGSDVRLIFLVRDPVDRAVSHAKHLIISGRPFDLEAELGPEDPVCELGCYEHQLQPWLESFDRESVLIIDMVDLIRNWAETSITICEHLGIDPQTMPSSLTQSNSSNDSRPSTGLAGSILASDAYLKLVQERLPMSLRRALRRVILRRAPEPEISSADILVTDEALDRWAADKQRFIELTGVSYASEVLDRRLAERESPRD